MSTLRQRSMKKEYEKALNTVKTLYEINDKFRTDIRESSETVLRGFKSGRKRGGDDDEMFDLDEGVKYLLKELAILTVVPRIWKDCSEEFMLVYHRRWPVLERFCEGKLRWHFKTLSGFRRLQSGLTLNKYDKHVLF